VSVPWQETEISEEVMVQCPCGSLNASVHGGRTLSRRCGGSYTYGAEWGEVTDDCTFSSTTFQLCNITTVRHIYHSFPDTALSQTTGLRHNVVINACTSQPRPSPPHTPTKQLADISQQAGAMAQATEDSPSFSSLDFTIAAAIMRIFADSPLSSTGTEVACYMYHTSL